MSDTSQQPTTGQAFLEAWQRTIQPKLSQLLSLLGTHAVAKNLALAQVITYLPVLTEGKQLLKAEPLCLLGNPALQDFHRACCEQGLPLTHLGPMGKVWESGVVQVVQQAGNLPEDMHPLNRLHAGLAALTVREVVYLPVYDAAPGATARGVVAALELMVNPTSSTDMVVANLISAVAEVMDQLSLALSNPVQQPQLPQPSGKTISRHSAPPDPSRHGSFEANNGAWDSRSFGSGGGGSGMGMARTTSVRMLHGDL